MTPEDHYRSLVEVLLADPEVTEGDPNAARGKFGSSGLKVGGRIFTMLIRGKLVLKLPAKRVESLISSGDGEPFDANKGKPMKEWVSLRPESRLEWTAVAKEALEFVRG